VLGRHLDSPYKGVDMKQLCVLAEFVLLLCILTILLEVEAPVVKPATTLKLVPLSVVPYKTKVKVVSEPRPLPIKAASKPVSKTYIVLARVSAYCPCAKCCGVMDGITASNTSAWKPGIAADWSWLPRGTKVSVPGYGLHSIDDKGGKLKRKYWNGGIPRLDIRFSYHWQARKWGIKYMKVTVYK